MERADGNKDYSKKEAAEVAGCDERTIHRAIKAQQLSARKVPLPGGGEKVLINGADLNAWIDQREQDKKPKHTLAVTRQADKGEAVSPDIASLVRVVLENQSQLQAFYQQKQIGYGRPRRDKLPLTERLTVTLDEAARMSGIPNARAEIKAAIENKELKAIKRKRGKYDVYRIMQEDLREWLKSLRS